MRPEIEAVLKKHGILMFDLFMTDLFTYTLRTDKPATPGLERDLLAVIPNVVNIEFALLQDPPDSLPQFAGYAKYKADEKLEKGDVVALDPNTEGAKKAASSVTHPAHYNSGKIEVIEFIEDQGHGPGFCRGSAIKYISRAGRKDPAKEIEDLEKAIWYLKREIEILRATQEGRGATRPNDMNPRHKS